VRLNPRLEAFLRQDRSESSDLASTVQGLEALLVEEGNRPPEE
jgi:flagellar biosynthesis/type III secretory pathway ATPase